MVNFVLIFFFFLQPVAQWVKNVPVMQETQETWV